MVLVTYLFGGLFFLGTSFTQFNGKGFWTRDAYLEVWLGALVQEIDHSHSLSEAEWLALVRQEWHLQATAGFSGWIHPDLDEWITNDEEKHLLIAVSEWAVTALAAYGDVIPCNVLNALTSDETISSSEKDFTVDSPSAPFLRVGRAFIQLLKGELITTVGDKDAYVGAPSPEEWYRGEKAGKTVIREKR
jgi:hypothetical protein